MDSYEEWGHRADAVVTCLSGALAVCVTVLGIAYLAGASLLLPYSPLFLAAAAFWIAGIVWSFSVRVREGCFSHASSQMAIAMGSGCLCTLSLCFRVATPPTASMTNVLPERVLHQLVDACCWWFHL